MPHRGDCQGFVVIFYLVIITLKTVSYKLNRSKFFNFHMKKNTLQQNFQFTIYSGRQRRHSQSWWCDFNAKKRSFCLLEKAARGPIQAAATNDYCKVTLFRKHN